MKFLTQAVFLLAILAVASAGVPAQQPSADLKSQVEQARSLYERGNYEEAQKMYDALLPRLRGQGPSRELTEVLANESDAANTAGNYDLAIAMAREMAQVCRQLHDSLCEAKALNDEGLAASNAGNYGPAAQALEAAMGLLGKDGDAPTSVLVLNNLGNVFYYQAKYSEALRTYESAMAYVEKAGAQPWAASWRQVTRLNLATLYQRLGNDQRAISIYHEVADKPLLSARELSHVFANLGILYRHMGDAEAALKNYHSAERGYEKDKDVDGELGALKNIGIVQALDLNRPTDALKTFDQALKLATETRNQREIMQVRLYRGKTLLGMGAFDPAAKEFTAALVMANQLGTVEEQWKALYSLGRIDEAQSHNEAAEQKFRAAAEKIESLRSRLQLSRLRSDFLADKRDVYDALITLLLEKNDTAAAFEYMERSRARVFQDRFYAGEVKPGALNLGSVQQQLKPDTALVEFWTGTDEVAALWITSSGSGIARKKFSPEEMNTFQQTVSGLPENMGDDWRQGFRKVSALAPEGIAPFLQRQYKHLLIVPDGFLSLVPFDLMPDENGRPLLEQHDLTYLPSAVLLLRGAEEQVTQKLGFPWQRELLAFGDPAVTGNGESTLLSERSGGPSLGALPNTAAEIRGIAHLSAGRTELYLGVADQKAQFFDAARTGVPLLHVSTHAIADMDNPERSRLLFSPGQPDQANDYVFLKELYDLDLRGTDLATLSACDTERGRLVPGEGIQAFSRALLAAGSRSALTTLWRVPDAPTAQFMQQFYYFLLKKHQTKAEALRSAKLEFLRSGTELSHPRYWAAFVLNGDGESGVPRFLSWQLLLAPALAAFALALLIWQARRKRTERAAKSAKVQGN
ncbi:MAG TPA: CHAT domain-containing tetratricopeptide repeat protein [Terriglobales bacterium]|nr:CHAT domain-containing tetratricopeptide repeat protein [Terriglobales bacterium]